MRSNLSIILRRLARSHRDATLLLRCGRPIRPYIGVRHMRLTRVFARHRRVRRAGPTRLPDLAPSALRSVATSVWQKECVICPRLPAARTKTQYLDHWPTDSLLSTATAPYQVDAPLHSREPLLTGIEQRSRATSNNCTDSPLHLPEATKERENLRWDRSD